MKKLLLLFSILFSVFTFAQDTKFKFGIQAGLNYSGLRGYSLPNENENPERAAFAYLGGITVEYQLKDRFSLRVELNYERKSEKVDGSRMSSPNFNNDPQIIYFTSKRNFDYVVLPVLLKYHFTKKNSFYVNGGPFISHLLKSKLTNDVDNPEFATDDIDLTKKFESTDFGFSLGVGKNFELGNNKMLHLEIRNNLGLAKINKYDYWNGGYVRTNSVNFIVGYSFN